jgi:hypothetical protein
VKITLALATMLLSAAGASAEEQAACRVLCAPEFKVEPTVTFTNLFRAPRIVHDDGTSTREKRERDFELILSTELPTRIEWLEFTVEAIFLPFDRDSTPELEFETNFVWLPDRRTGGWVTSHFDVVDKFSAAERPVDTRAYTHKLNLELDTSVSLFTWLNEGHWLRDLEIEGSLDYVATDASPWSFSLVFVVPIAPR